VIKHHALESPQQPRWEPLIKTTFLVDLFSLVSRFMLYYDGFVQCTDGECAKVWEDSQLAAWPHVCALPSRLLGFLSVMQQNIINRKWGPYSAHSSHISMIADAAENLDKRRETKHVCGLEEGGVYHIMDELSLSDTFVGEVLHHVRLIQNEKVLIFYLSNFRLFKALHITKNTDVQMQACLYAFTSRGGPLYPTRPVRKCARMVLTDLYPKGQLSRQVVFLLFRLLHPYYASKSFFYYIYQWIFFYLAVLLAFLIAPFMKSKKQAPVQNAQPG